MHVHSKYSQDAKNHSITELSGAALDRGLSGIAITDHFDACYAPIGFPFYLAHEAERRADYERACQRVDGQIQILWGLELGHPYQQKEISESFLRAREFDFILGSVHFLNDGRDIYEITCKSEAEADAVFRAYFAQLLELLSFGCFDSLAHLDYPMRVMQGVLQTSSTERYREQIEPVLEALVRQGVALEINTRGLMDWKHRTEPEEWVLERYRALGGKYITFGSDAHNIKNLGGGIEKAIQIAKKVGFTHQTIFVARRPVMIPLE